MIMPPFVASRMTAHRPPRQRSQRDGEILVELTTNYFLVDHVSVSCFEQSHTRRYWGCTVSLRPSSQVRQNPASLKKSSQASVRPTRALRHRRSDAGTVVAYQVRGRASQQFSQFMSALGQKRTSKHVRAMSALRVERTFAAKSATSVYGIRVFAN